MGAIRKSSRRGLVRELAVALDAGKEEVIAFAHRHSLLSPTTGCWVWQGPVQATGYAYMVDPREPIYRPSMPRKAVHRIICEVVHRPMRDEEHARHLCHNTACVNPKHLAPGSQSENMMDSVRDGRWTFTRGEGNGRAKITEDDVRALRATYRWRTPGEAASWADRLGISESMVRQVMSGRAWPHVTAGGI